MIRNICFILTFIFSAAVFSRTVSIDILHTADIHGNVFGSGVDRKSSQTGGLLRCSLIVDELRQSGLNVVLIDCGDLFQGAPESYLTKGEIVAEIVKKMKYDCLILGNHEFDWGIDYLREFYFLVETPVLAADVYFKKESARIKPIKQFIIKEIEGVKIIVIGLSNPNMPNWFTDKTLKNIEFKKPVTALREILPVVRKELPDIIILAVHQGYRAYGDNPANMINSIAANFPELSVIIGAHTHIGIPESEINGILYSQADPYGRNIGRITLAYDTGTKRVTEKKAVLIPADNTIEDIIEKNKSYKKIIGETEIWLSKIIGEAECDFTADQIFPGQSGTQALIAGAIAENTAADIVFHGALSEAVIYSGPIRVRDIWRMVPYENNIELAELTINDISRILEENSRYFGTRQFRGVYGMTYKLNFQDGFGQIGEIIIKGISTADAEQRIKVAFNDFDTASAGGRFPVLRQIVEKEESRLKDTGFNTRSMVIKFIENHPRLNLTTMPLSAGAVVMEKK